MTKIGLAHKQRTTLVIERKDMYARYAIQHTVYRILITLRPLSHTVRGDRRKYTGPLPAANRAASQPGGL